MKKLKVMLILVATTVAACQESGSKENAEANSSKELAMSGCDSTCKTSCCTYPDKATNGCLCAKKGTDCDSHCCAAHAKGGEAQGHGDGNHKGKEHGNDNHKH